jgi:hypothetical protein
MTLWLAFQGSVVYSSGHYIPFLDNFMVQIRETRNGVYLLIVELNFIGQVFILATYS